jgi:dihydroneopterin aldolase
MCYSNQNRSKNIEEEDPMTDIVFIKDLTAYAVIGAYDWEHTIKQELRFNLEMAWDFSKAAETDDVQYCLNYAEISEKILAFVEKSRFHLIETLAYKIADMLQADYHLPWLRLEVHKPKAVAQAKNVGVVVERGKR